MAGEADHADGDRCPHCGGPSNYLRRHHPRSPGPRRWGLHAPDGEGRAMQPKVPRQKSLSTTRAPLSELHFALDLPGLDGRLVTTDIMIGHDKVEFRCQPGLGHARLVGTAGRDVLRQWLSLPFGIYAYGNMVWEALDSQIVIHIKDFVAGHPLENDVLETLRRHV